MPQYVMLNQPNKMDWLEKPAAQAGNFLWQMALSNYAARMRQEEAARERQAEEERYDKRMDTQLAISGFQQIPETEAVPQGAIKVGNKFYKKVATEYNKVEIDGIPYTYEKGGRLYPLNKSDDKDTSAVRTFEAVHYGKEVPELRGTPEYVSKWNKENASKAIRIGMDEKVATQEAMKDVDRRSFVQTAAWDNQVADVTRSKFDKDTWNDMPTWQREKEVFATADNDIKTVYKEFNPYFGVKDGVEGWFGKNPKTGKFELIKRRKSNKIEQPSNAPVPTNPNEPGVVRKKF